MLYLKENITFLCAENGTSFDEFLVENGIHVIEELSVKELQSFAIENKISLQSLLFKPLNKKTLSHKINKIKLLILDVDGVLTDGGMYFSESGDQMKKYNTKDGMAIMHLTKKGFQVGIISSGFKLNMVESRANLLGIQNVYVGRENKLLILNQWCEKLGLNLNEVAIIGDDINDLSVMKSVGLSVCPNDAVTPVKQQVDLILTKKGGDACVREFIDEYLVPNWFIN